MLAWQVEEQRPIDEEPLQAVEVDEPEPGDGEVLVAVRTCGVCRTDLHVAEGDLASRRDRVVPGHEVVGEVAATGPGADRFEVGERIGVAWLRSTCQRCRFCRRDQENLCLDPTFTGWTHDGGYAEALVAPEAYAYRVPDALDDLHAAPLLCAGIIGWRALQLAAVRPGGRLGIWGFGGSAHVTAQVAVAQGLELHVVTRSEDSRELARDLGAVWTGDNGEEPPVPLDGAILFAPVGDLVPEALAALDRGATLAVAGIHLTDVPRLDYQDHLFQERRLRSVTANTRADGEQLLRLAARIGIETTVTPYPLDAADEALADLAAGAFPGTAVLEVGGV